MIDYKKIKLNEEEQAVFLESEGMAIGLGHCQGYAGDEVVRILKENGVTSGLINLGGNIVVVNAKSDGTPWRIGIKNPRMEEDKGQGKHVMVVETDGNAVVTSGDYERYMVEIYEETESATTIFLIPRPAIQLKTASSVQRLSLTAH